MLCACPTSTCFCIEHQFGSWAALAARSFRRLRGHGSFFGVQDRQGLRRADSTILAVYKTKRIIRVELGKSLGQICSKRIDSA